MRVLIWKAAIKLYIYNGLYDSFDKGNSRNDLCLCIVLCTGTMYIRIYPYITESLEQQSDSYIHTHNTMTCYGELL